LAPYRTTAESFEGLRSYVDIDLDGLQEKVVRVLGGQDVPIDPSSFDSHIVTFGCADDVLTLLVHLGYLA
jgi:hypothetical protein